MEIFRQKRYSYLIVLFLFVFCPGIAQSSSDTISVKRLTKFPLATLDYTYYSSSDYNKDNLNHKIGMNEYKAKVQFAVKLKEKKTFLLNRIYITQFDAYASKETNQTFKDQYYSISYSLGLIQLLKNRWKIVGILSPTLASDFNHAASSHDFILQSSVLISKRASANFEYGFGAALSTRFGRELVIPLLSYVCINDKWSHQGVLPAYIASYYMANKTEIGIKVSTFGNVYNASNSIESNLELDKLGYSRITIGPDLKFCIYKSFYANINTGITVRNHLYSITSAGELEMELNANPKFFLNIGLSILK